MFAPVNAFHFLAPSAFICISTAGFPLSSKSCEAFVTTSPSKGALPKSFTKYISTISSLTFVPFARAFTSYNALALAGKRA